MNRLQKRRAALGLTQPQVAAALKATEPRVDAQTVCRYERGVCLPTPSQLEALEAILQAARSELYDRGDIDLTVGFKRPAAPPSHADKLRKCYRIPRAFADALPPDLLDVCGYASWQSWHDACLKRLLGEYAARKKKMPVAAGTAHEHKTNYSPPV